MPRILPILTPRGLWRERNDIRPLWWRDMARYSCVGVALCIIGSYAVWEPIARVGALLLLWVVICAALGGEHRDDDDHPGAPRPPAWPRGGRGRRIDRGHQGRRRTAPRPHTRTRPARREPVA